MKMNARQFHEKIARMEAKRAEARREALAWVGRRIARQVAIYSPKDTNRLVRGYLLGFQKIGHLDVAMPALERSRYVQQAIKVLVDQYDFFRDLSDGIRERIKSRYPDGRARGRAAGYNALHAKLRTAQKRRDRAREELEKFRSAPYGIIMSPLRWSYDTVYNDGRHVVTVRPNPYGGSGALKESPTRTTARILNMEPHAAFVNSNGTSGAGAMREAINAATKGTIFAGAAKKYIRSIQNVAQVQGSARERFLAGR